MEGILDSVSPIARIQHQIYQSRLNENQTNSTVTLDNDNWIEGIFQGIQSAREQEQKTEKEVTNNAHSKTTNKEGVANGKRFIRLLTVQSDVYFR